MFGGRKFFERQISFDRLRLAGAIMEQEGVTIRTESERNIKRCRVIESLLHSLTDCVIVVFRLKDRDRDGGLMVKHVVGAFWFADGDYAAWRLYFTHVYLACNPLGMVLEALDPEEAEGWHAHFEIDPGDADVVAERLAKLPEVEAELFSMPTTRLEALTVVFEALRAHMESQNTSDVRFGPDDYR